MVSPEKMVSRLCAVLIRALNLGSRAEPRWRLGPAVMHTSGSLCTDLYSAICLFCDSFLEQFTSRLPAQSSGRKFINHHFQFYTSRKYWIPRQGLKTRFEVRFGSKAKDGVNRNRWVGVTLHPVSKAQEGESGGRQPEHQRQGKNRTRTGDTQVRWN